MAAAGAACPCVSSFDSVTYGLIRSGSKSSAAAISAERAARCSSPGNRAVRAPQAQAGPLLPGSAPVPGLAPCSPPHSGHICPVIVGSPPL
ncbi:hypothetical protein GCM10010518_16470 [Kitasatospora cinereorecta]